jgi:alpha-L-rhamnosidase
MTRFASLSNLMDVPTDCPQRERRGWLGDAQLSCQTTISNFDMGAFYTKWMRDIRDSQEFYKTGEIPDCVPFYGHGGLPADPAWSAAYPLITSWVADYYDDDRIITAQYDGIKAYMDSQIGQLSKGVLTFARCESRAHQKNVAVVIPRACGFPPCLLPSLLTFMPPAPTQPLPHPPPLTHPADGDWCSVADGPATSCVFTRPDISTTYFIMGLDILADFANRTGNSGDAQKYGSLSQTTRALYNQNWEHGAGTPDAYYQDGYPISQILALHIGVVPAADQAAVANTLVNLINNGSHSGFPNSPTGGIVFTKYAWPVLSSIGRTDLAMTLMLAKGMPSYDFWIEGSETQNSWVPATTLWENWQSTGFAPEGSYNHVSRGK